MGFLEIVIVGGVVIFVISALARNLNKTEADKAKPSALVRGWNASGAPKVESTRVLPAVRELAGRGVGHLTGRAQQAVKNRWDAGAERREAKAETQREIIAEVKDAAKRKALDNARKVTDAVSARWDNHRPAWTRRRADTGDTPDPSSPWTPTSDNPDVVTGPETPDGTGRVRLILADRDQPATDQPELTASAQCRTCGTEHTATVPAGEGGVEVPCGCGAKLYFFRRRPEDPAPEGARPAEVVAPDAPPTEEARPTLRLVPKEDTDMTATTTEGAAVVEPTAIIAPADWNATAARVTNFDPDDDAELIDFMAQEVAGMSAYAAAYEALFETCTKEIGLDPRAVQALGEFGEKVVELTGEMNLVHKRFVAFYAEVLNFVGEGGVMPHDGRFFSGNVSA